METGLRAELTAVAHWQDHCNVEIPPVVIDVKFVEPWEVNAQAAMTTGTEVRINRRTAHGQLGQIFRHELAHVFLNLTLDSSWSGNPLIQETLALYLSGDDQRLRREPGHFTRQAEALRYLQRLSFAPGPRFLSALSALLVNPRVRQSVKDLTCALAKRKATQDAEAQLIRILGQERVQVPRGPIAYLVVDGLTGEPLAMRGDIHRPVEVGSMLKPVFLRLFPEMLAPRDCRGSTVTRTIRGMSWQQALQQSCNGFFLGAKELDWSKWNRHFTRFGIPRERTEIATAQEAIGLIPRVQLSLLEMAAVYREIMLEQPEILAALKGALASGTLSDLPDSTFFLRKGAQLKTGSVRTLNGRPLQGWIGGRIGEVFVFARGEGFGGYELLAQIRPLVETWSQIPLRAARVQVLALVPEAAIEIRCERGLAVVGTKDFPQVTSATLKANDSVHCLSGGLVVRFGGKDGSRSQRTYWGKMSYQPPPQLRPPSGQPPGIRQARARRGSAFVLETTERAYVSRVLASEMAKGRRETLKALAFVVRQNLQSGRHGDRPLCDTTHCQVFGPSDWASPAKIQTYATAYDAIASLPVSPNRFLNFAKGGTAPWRAVRLRGDLLKLAGPRDRDLDVRASGAEVRVNGLRYSCEEFRNSLKLLSCPHTITRESDRFIFHGRGEGHGIGMDLLKADALAAEGRSFKELLEFSY